MAKKKQIKAMTKETKQHGLLLKIWLILMVIANIISALTYLLFNSTVSAYYPNMPSNLFYLYGLISIADVVFLGYLFNWKKWGFYALCATAAAIFIMNISIGIDMITAVFGFSSVFLLYLILRPKWNLLD